MESGTTPSCPVDPYSIPKASFLTAPKAVEEALEDPRAQGLSNDLEFAMIEVQVAVPA
jgi:hypothetical protein